MVTLDRFLICLAALSLTALLFIFPVAANPMPGQGSFQFTLKGHVVNGLLEDPVIQPDGTITMQMVISDSISTSFGSIPVNGNGVWQGMQAGSAVSGTINGVTGTVQACFIFLCGNVTYVGSGLWMGTITTSTIPGALTTLPLASGTFSGTITFTSSPFPGVPLNTPQPVTGTWNVQLIQQLPS